MKKILTFLLYLSFPMFAYSQAETFGNPASTTLITAYTGWSNSSVAYSGTGDVRNSSPSSGYSGVSGQGNVFLTTGGTRTLIISGIIPNAGATSGTLSFGIFKSTTSSNGSELTISYTNATGASGITLPTGSGTAAWALRSIPLSFAGGDISITFTNTSTTTQFRLDDIQLTFTSLPIELSKFDCKVEGSHTSLSFTTASELNNNFFAIERSSDGRTFEQIGEVKGAGTSYTQQDYTYTDEKPLRGINYYRLKQVDFDGQFTYSSVVSVQFGKAGNVVIYPTPATETVNVRLEESLATDAQWQIVDMTGRVLSAGVFAAEQVQYSLPVANLTQGAYILRVTADQVVLTQQFRKQ